MRNPGEKLLILDCSSLLSVAFYRNVPAEYYGAKTEEKRHEVLKKLKQTEDGRYTNGVYGMLTNLLSIIKSYKITHIVGGWDITRDTFRREIYPDYKGTREDSPPELLEQYRTSQELFKDMNIPQFYFTQYEADDVIGTFAKKFENDIETIIYTKDQDALQLVNDLTKVWLITGKSKDMYSSLGFDYKEITKNVPWNVFEFTPLYVEEFYKIDDPIKIIDRKSLEGDSSDNIPGVHKIGEKTSVPLIREFGSMEEIYDYIENTPTSEVKAMFKELGVPTAALTYLTKEAEEGKLSAKQSAYLSKKLATIKTDIQELSEVTLESLRLNINEKGKIQKFKELEFKTLL